MMDGRRLDEVRKSMEATKAIREQGFPTTSIPYGYVSVKDEHLGRKVWRFSEDAENVRSIFKSFLEDPDRQFTKLAEERGVSRQLLRKILRNRDYTGGFNWKGQFFRVEPQVIPPLVTNDEFEAAQWWIPETYPKFENDLAVFNFISARGPVDRRTILEDLKLPTTTLHRVLHRLLARRIIKAGGDVRRSNRGRNKNLYWAV